MGRQRQKPLPYPLDSVRLFLPRVEPWAVFCNAFGVERKQKTINLFDEISAINTDQTPFYGA